MFPLLLKTAYENSKKEFLLSFFTFLFAFTAFLIVRGISAGVVETVERESKPLFAADLTVSSAYAFSSGQVAAVAQYCSEPSAKCVRRVAFQSSFADKEGRPGLVKVVAAEPGYPFYGDLQISDGLPDSKSPTNSVRPSFSGISENRPTASGAFADSSTVARYASGGTLPFFGEKLSIEGEIGSFPNSWFSFGDEGNVVIVPYSTALRIKEIGTLSRSEFSVLFKTENDPATFALEKRMKADPVLKDLRIRTFRQGFWGTANLVQNITKYASDALSAIFLLSGIAAFFFSRSVWISNRRYLSILRILGAPRFFVGTIFSVFFCAGALLALLFSVLAAYLFFSFPILPGFWKDFSLSLNSIWELFLSVPFVLLPALIPGINSLLKTPPLSGLSEPKFSVPGVWESLIATITSLISVFVFLFFILNQSVLEAFVSSLVVVTVFIVVTLLSHGGITQLSNFFLKRKSNDFAAFDAVRLSVSPGSPALPVVTSFVLPAILFAAFASIAFHFSLELERLSTDSADVFVMNLLPKDVPSVVAEFPKAESFSIIRARISKINGNTLAQHLKTESPSREFTREFNVTSSLLKDDVIEGSKGGLKIGEVSLDRDFADRLSLKVGDAIVFTIMGREFPLRTISIRESSRQGIRPFFYFQVAPGEFSNVPETYFFAAKTEDPEFFKKRVLELSGPHVSFVDVRETVKLVKEASEKILSAVTAFLVAVGFSALTVAMAALSSLKIFRRMRERTYSLLGADKSFLRRHSSYTLAFYAVAAFSIAALLAFPAVWGGIASLSFLQFSFVAAFEAMGALFVFLTFATLAVAVSDRRGS